MLLSLQLLTAPTVEPVLVADLKKHLRIAPTFTDDDDILQTYAVAARRYAEHYTRRAFFAQQWKVTLDHFPQTPQTPRTVNPSMRRDFPYYAGIWSNSTIALPKPRLVSVESVKYTDGSGTEQTVDPANYRVDLTSEPARVVPGPGLFWPYVTAYLPGSVKIAFTAGAYTTKADCPEDIRVAIMLLAAHWYAHPEAAGTGGAEMPFSVSALLSPHRFNCLDLSEVV